MKMARSEEEGTGDKDKTGSATSCLSGKSTGDTDKSVLSRRLSSLQQSESTMSYGMSSAVTNNGRNTNIYKPSAMSSSKKRQGLSRISSRASSAVSTTYQALPAIHSSHNSERHVHANTLQQRSQYDAPNDAGSHSGRFDNLVGNSSRNHSPVKLPKPDSFTSENRYSRHAVLPPAEHVMTSGVTSGQRQTRTSSNLLGSSEHHGSESNTNSLGWTDMFSKSRRRTKNVPSWFYTQTASYNMSNNHNPSDSGVPNNVYIAGGVHENNDVKPEPEVPSLAEAESEKSAAPVLRTLQMESELDQYVNFLEKKKGRRNDFSTSILSQGDNLKRTGGPIARPHTQQRALLERQKTRFGSDFLKDSTTPLYQNIRSQQNRTNQLHTDLKLALDKR